MPTLDYQPPERRDNYQWTVLKRWAIASAGALVFLTIVQLVIWQGLRANAPARARPATTAPSSSL